jgi:hypothetical protein
MLLDQDIPHSIQPPPMYRICYFQCSDLADHECAEAVLHWQMKIVCDEEARLWHHEMRPIMVRELLMND